MAILLAKGSTDTVFLGDPRPWPMRELVRAPMIMKGPGLPAGKRVEGFTQSCDVAQQLVMEWLGLPQRLPR